MPERDLHKSPKEVAPPFSEFRQHVSSQTNVAADPERSLWERLEAFEDLVDSEVGDTTFVRARHLEREYGLRQVFLKFEGSNPTGTQKDRIAFAQVKDALRQGYQTITTATCGNYGVALGLASVLAGLRCVIYVPEHSLSKRLKEIVSLGAELKLVGGSYEDAVQASQEHAVRDELYDANPGESNLSLQLQAYGQIAFEIYDELHDAPAVVAVPVSNGTTLAGIYKGFLQLYRRGKTSRVPHMVAGSSHNKNPIVRAMLRGTPTCEPLEASRIRETQINEPLVNWRSIDGDLALQAIRETDGWAANVSDRRMNELSRFLRENEGWHILPASTAGLHALLSAHQEHPMSPERYVVLLTGRNT